MLIDLVVGVIKIGSVWVGLMAVDKDGWAKACHFLGFSLHPIEF